MMIFETDFFKPTSELHLAIPVTSFRNATIVIISVARGVLESLSITEAYCQPYLQEIKWEF